ncbi:hypothetical protein [Caulifigura coniformis]|uniref:hypothetical protein n=1 Tax=Caulifigura coniformis TaxID=2527983 RepID=UPI00119DC6EE|nr:hypothetical protein [Caulifigura coniformis]
MQTQRPEEYRKIIESKLDDARQRRIQANQEPRLATRKRLIETSRDEIATLEAELKRVKARRGQRESLGPHVSGLPMLVKREALERKQPLMPLDWSRLAVGQVGEVGICSFGNHAGESIRCQRKLEAGAFLGCHSVHDGFGYDRIIESKSVVFVGVDKSDDGEELREKECFSITFTAVVTGTTQLEVPAAGLQTVFVVEKFDPDMPFH